MIDLLTRRQWELAIDEAGLQLRGYRLLWKPGAIRPRRSGSPRPTTDAVVRGSPTPHRPRPTGLQNPSFQVPDWEACLPALPAESEAEPRDPRVTGQSPARPESGRPAVASSGEVGRPAPLRERSEPLPTRSRRYGVGKEIGGAVYVHRQYEDRLGPTVIWAKRLIPADYAYDVVKVNRGQTVGLSTLNPFAYNWAMSDRGWKQETERGCTRDVDDNYAHR